MRNSEIPSGFGRLGAVSLEQSIKTLNPLEPLTVCECDDLRQAIEVMKSFNIGCAVVVDMEGKLTGIVTERDILLKWALANRQAEDVTIAEIMSPNPHVLHDDDTLAAALFTMSQGGFRHLPIVNDAGRPTGIVSVKDLVDYISIECMRNLVSDGHHHSK